MASDTIVYTGAWRNWTKGPVFGGTITMSLLDGPILVAFFALFVRLVGSHLWNIFCYAVHQWRSKRGEQDAFHHQQQALLRNSSSVTSTLWLWLTVGWAWRSKRAHTYWRSLAFITAAILQIVAFAIAGILSSLITRSMDMDALILSPNCGSWPVDLQFLSTTSENLTDKATGTLEKEAAYRQNARAEMRSSLAYAQNCYSDSTVNCGQYIVNSLPQVTIDNTSNCPFDDALCLTRALYIDTGFIDSALHLGINARKEDRVQYRRTTTCAVLDPNERARSAVNLDSAAYPYENMTYYFYGPDAEGNDFTKSFSNYTYEGVYAFWYDLQSASSFGDFKPIPALHPENGDVDILFLQTELVYLNPVDDPWFAAHTKVEPKGAVAPFYVTDNNPSNVGCINQHQFCNPNLPNGSACTDLTGIFLAYNQSVSDLSFSPIQNATFTRLAEAAVAASRDNLVLALDQDITIASQEVAGNRVIGLPDNQWQLEVLNIDSIMLAYMQSLMVSYVTGPGETSFPSYQRYIEYPTIPEEQQICRSQIVWRNDYYHFSILGIALILGLGLFIILLNLSLEPFIRLLREIRENDHGLYKQLEWDMTETLQLQRLVYEGQGSGTWYGAPDQIPVTAHGDKFSIPEWTGMGDAKRISLSGSSTLGKVTSPLMKSEGRTVVTEL